MMNIRKATVDDAFAVMELHERSVLALCRVDYSPEQLKEWVDQSTFEKYQVRLENHRAYIAEYNDKMIGYVRWNPATDELCSIFVDSGYVRQGVATKLMQIAAEDAISHGVNEFWLDASLTAVPFYKALGWTYVKQALHGSLQCVRMTKHLP